MLVRGGPAHAGRRGAGRRELSSAVRLGRAAPSTAALLLGRDPSAALRRARPRPPPPPVRAVALIAFGRPACGRDGSSPPSRRDGAGGADLTSAPGGPRIGLVVGAAYLLAAVGELAEAGPCCVAPPIGWTQQIRAYAGDRWWVLGCSSWSWLWARAGRVRHARAARPRRRSLAQRTGRRSAAGWITGPVALAWRLRARACSRGRSRSPCSAPSGLDAQHLGRPRRQEPRLARGILQLRRHGQPRRRLPRDLTAPLRRRRLRLRHLDRATSARGGGGRSGRAAPRRRAVPRRVGDGPRQRGARGVDTPAGRRRSDARGGVRRSGR